MDKKLIFRTCVYLFGLAMVFVFKTMLTGDSSEVKPAVDIAKLALPPANFQWCSDKRGTLQWKNENIRKKYQKWSDAALRKKFCNVDIEPLSGSELKTAKFNDLAFGADAQAALVKLEWDKSLKIYRAAGLPFKSKKLDRELLDVAQ